MTEIQGYNQPTPQTNNATSGLELASAALLRAKKVLITTHINPDGDAIGSALGLAHILWSMGKEADVVSQDGAGQRYQFLPGSERILTDAEGEYDTGIAVDCANAGRTGSVCGSLLACPTVIRVDHHAVGQSFGDIEYMDTRAAAVGEMITEIADHMGARIPREAGVCLLASIVEDTGCFQFSSASERTFQICSELVASGADFHWVVQKLFWSVPTGALRLRGKLLDKMNLEADGRLAWTLASDKDLEEYGAIHEDMDEVAHDLLRGDKVEVAVLLRETSKDYRVSLRSKSVVNVAEAARQFGGGGHALAAGCRISRTEGALESLLESLGAALKNSD